MKRCLFKAFLGFTNFDFSFWPSTRYSEVDFRLLSWLRALVKSKFMFSLAYFGDLVAQLKLIECDQH